MRRWLLLALLLLVPGYLRAQNHPEHCHAKTTTTCSIPNILANGTIVMQTVPAVGTGCSTPTDGFGLTYTAILTQAFTDSFGGQHACSYWAHNLTHTGTDTVTVSGTNVQITYGAWYPPTDMLSTSNPVDKTCTCDTATANCGSANIPTGSSTVNSCSISSTVTNDILQWLFWGSLASSCAFESSTAVNNGPTVRKYIDSTTGCDQLWINSEVASSPVTLDPSGSPFGPLVLQFATSNTGGSPAFFAVQLITFFPGSVPQNAKRRQPPFLLRFHPQRIWRTMRASL